MDHFDGQHQLRPMIGRDPDETNRVATPLELHFDLTFVAAFNRAADEAAHFIAEGHAGTAAVGFVFVSSTVCLVVAAWGAGLGVSLLLVMLAPAVTVVGYETVGHRRMAQVLRQVLG